MLRSDNELKNPTVLIVVDRRDLDNQINKTFGGADIKNLIKVKSCKYFFIMTIRAVGNFILLTDDPKIVNIRLLLLFVG
uniref:SWI2/SNF2 ATPase domain-containing protein n=1 Tax=Arsenophonus endosymbiont of Trialeurodes vaporariorum TaxID=235567 RepID=A0A3B0MBB2_9GAMM